MRASDDNGEDENQVRWIAHGSNLRAVCSDVSRPASAAKPPQLDSPWGAKASESQLQAE